jgi:hypothetical protein
MIPESLPYPKIYELGQVPELKDKYCYVVKSYPLSGLAILICCDGDDLHLRFTDFNGVEVDPVEGKLLGIIITVMRTVKIKQSMFYFSDQRLVDVRLSANKFCSPGFIKDIFGKAGVPIQEYIDKPIQLDDNGMKLIMSNKYDCGVIIKPSTFKSIIRNDDVIPMYGVRHEIKQVT